MTASGPRIVIRHLSGSKANQIDQFDVTSVKEITLGRDPGSTIAYDMQRDDEVSRRHAVIRVHNQEDRYYFRLADLNSSNGTMLNGEQIGDECELHPEDSVELGAGGPKFIFDMQARPSYLQAHMRAMPAVDPTATRLVPADDEALEFGAADTNVVAADNTPQRMPSGNSGNSRQVRIAALAAVVVLAIAGAGAMWWHGQSVAAGLQQEMNVQAPQPDAIKGETVQRNALP